MPGDSRCHRRLTSSYSRGYSTHTNSTPRYKNTGDSDVLLMLYVADEEQMAEVRGKGEGEEGLDLPTSHQARFSLDSQNLKFSFNAKEYNIMNVFLSHKMVRHGSQMQGGPFKKSSNEPLLKVAKGKKTHRKTVPSSGIAKPKRPLTAYNLFFQDEQKKINSTKEKKPVGLAENTAKLVSLGWETISPERKAYYFQLANEEKFRYYNEKSECNDKVELIDSNGKGISSVDTEGNDVVPLEWKVHDGQAHDDSIAGSSYSHASIALLASKLDAESIEFLIKALK